MAADAAWRQHYLDELDAAYLYRALARVEPEDRRRSIFERLASVEDQHVERWRTIFRDHGSELPAFAPTLRSRVLAWVAARFGTSMVLPMVLADETREISAYLRLADRSTHRATHDAAVAIASESASHAQELSEALGRAGEPWHATAGSSYLRSVIYGFNDGLTANFGLVAGVVGAELAPSIVIITGGAGAFADALSMGASGYLAAKSEAEVAARQIALERDEIRMMPDLEETELALVYEARGLTPARARETAAALMADPVRALDASVRDELGIRAPAVSPLSDGMVTGTATAVGALIPLVPFLVMPSAYALWVSLTVSMLAHFGVGAARSVFTGRGLLRSGWDMFLVGFGVAAAGYLIGSFLLS